MGSINCPNSNFQLAAVRANEDFENWVFLTQGKNRFFPCVKKTQFSKSSFARTAASWKLLFGQLIDPISTTKLPSFSPRSHLLTENEQKDFKFLCIFLVTLTCPKTRRIFFYLRKFLRYDLPVSSPNC